MGTLLQKTSSEPYKYYSKGASEIILSRCTTILDADGRRVPLTDSVRAEANKHISHMANEALRTIGLAYREVSSYSEADNLDSELTLIGICGIKVTP